MPPARRQRKRRSFRPKRRVNRRKPTGNSVSAMVRDNHASLSSTINNTVVPNTIYDFSHALVNSSRALVVAQEYQFYKIDYVEVRIKPLYDTYLDGSGNPIAPQLYFYKSLSQTSPTSLVALRQMGVNPASFSRDKNIVYRYKPAVEISPSAVGGGLGLIKRISPWLSCSTATSGGAFAGDATPHYGACFYIDQAGGNANIANVEVETHFKFKAPQVPNSSNAHVEHLVV